MKTYMHPAAALFTIVKTWRQPKCPSTEESMWYTCTQNTTQFIKNEINATCSDMGRGVEMITGRGIRERNRVSLLCGI